MTRDSQGGHIAHHDLVGGHVGEAGVGYVSLGDFLQDGAGLGSPQAQAGIGRADILDRNGAIFRHIDPKPGQIVLPEGRAGDDKEALLGQAGDGEIALDPAALVQAFGIDDRSDRLVDVVGADIVQEGQRAGTAHFKFIERSFIEQTGIRAGLAGVRNRWHATSCGGPSLSARARGGPVLHRA